MKYLIITLIFVLFVTVFNSIVGLAFVVEHMLYCGIGYFVVLQILDVLIHKTSKG